MDKKMTLFDNDGSSIKDFSVIKGTEIILKETASGKVIFRGHNKVIGSGSEFNAQKSILFDSGYEHTESDDSFLGLKNYDYGLNKADAFGVQHPLATPNNKKYLGSDSSANPLSVFGPAAGGTIASPTDGKSILYEYFTRRVCLFAVGIDGCGIDNSRVFRVNNTKWIAPYSYASYNPGGGIVDPEITNCLVPFKMKNINDDLTTDTDRSTYFGRSVVDNMVSYYFKAFDQAPIIQYRWADGRGLIDSSTDIYGESGSAEMEVVVELHMSITSSDCREYFRAINSNNSARINTISLCSGVPFLGTDRTGPGGSTVYKYYEDIRPFTKFNFPNESLIDSSKGIEINYYLYF
jgi:hypothetical protein